MKGTGKEVKFSIRISKKLYEEIEATACEKKRSVSEEVRMRLLSSYEKDLDGLGLLNENVEEMRQNTEKLKVQNDVMMRMFEHFLPNFFISHPSIMQSGMGKSEQIKAISEAKTRATKFMDEFEKELQEKDGELLGEIAMRFSVAE